MQNLLRKRYVITAVSLGVIGLVFYWLYSHAFIEISVSNSTSDGEFSYVLVDQKNGSRSEVKSSNRVFKKLVSRGDYEIQAWQNNKSYVAIRQTSGFLGSTKLNASLRSEGNRSFTGNNPNTCMYVLADRLASMPCNGSVEDFEIHIPASQTTATYTKKAAGPAALIEGFFANSTTAQAVVNAEAEVDGGGKIHARYSVTNDGVFEPSSYQKLDQLNSSKVYSFVEFDGGYAAISNDGDEALYYTALDQAPEQINLKPPGGSGQLFRSVSASGKNMFIVYSNDSSEHAEFEDPSGSRSHSEEVENKGVKKISSTVLVYSKSSTKQFKVSGSVIQALGCGEEKVCLRTADGKLSVYKVSNNTTEKIFALTGVRGVQNIANSFYAVTTNGIMALDIQKQDGYMVYTFGAYDYCGLANSSDRLIVCIADEGGNRRALSIDPTTEISDTIDDKIAQLQKLPELKYVSIYGSYIHLAAELGRLEYQSSIGGYGYDPEIIKSTSAAISSEIKRLGIDTSKYTVVNPYQ